jgi:hypothetical protein
VQGQQVLPKYIQTGVPGGMIITHQVLAFLVSKAAHGMREYLETQSSRHHCIVLCCKVTTL